MKRLLFAAVLALSAGLAGQALACPPAGYTRARLEALKATGWTLPDERARNRLAVALADCLASRDPVLRDAIAYDGLNHWLRGGLLSRETMLALADNLQGRLTAPEGRGFERPFAALALADVARADRLAPFLTPERRASLLNASLAYFGRVRDYRGFDDREGWRHGVAHGADLLLQLALNPAFGKPELSRIRDAIAGQIAPDRHPYVFGESERLAVAILYVAQRGIFTEAEWSAWLGTLAAPAPLASWDQAFGSQVALARLHNVKAFMQALYVNAGLDRNTADDVLLPGAGAALKALP